jgi:hypothetical protein
VPSFLVDSQDVKFYGPTPHRRGSHFCGLACVQTRTLDSTYVWSSNALQRVLSYRTDHPPNTVNGETREAVGAVHDGPRYDQSFEEGNERCHGAVVHPPAQRIAQSKLITS